MLAIARKHKNALQKCKRPSVTFFSYSCILFRPWKCKMKKNWGHFTLHSEKHPQIIPQINNFGKAHLQTPNLQPGNIPLWITLREETGPAEKLFCSRQSFYFFLSPSLSYLSSISGAFFYTRGKMQEREKNLRSHSHVHLFFRGSENGGSEKMGNGRRK